MKKLFLLEILTCSKACVCCVWVCLWFITLSTWSNKSSERGRLLQKSRKSSCIDLYLTNSPLSFQNSSSVFTGLSHFHKLFLTVFKTTFVRSKPKEPFYRDHKHFNHEYFEKDLKCALSTFEKINYQEFDKTFTEILNRHAPVKKKLTRAKEAP